MEYFLIDKGRCNRLHLAKSVLPSVLDRSIEDGESEPELKLQPLPDIDETPPDSDHGVQVFVLDSLLSSIG